MSLPPPTLIESPSCTFCNEDKAPDCFIMKEGQACFNNGICVDCYESESTTMEAHKRRCIYCLKVLGLDKFKGGAFFCQTCYTFCNNAAKRDAKGPFDTECANCHRELSHNGMCTSTWCTTCYKWEVKLLPDGQKRCQGCMVLKEVNKDTFRMDNGKFTNTCTLCRRATTQARAANINAVAATIDVTSTRKACHVCHVEKPLSQFDRHSTTRDGFDQ